MNTNNKTKKIVMNALLLAIGALLHQITPTLGFPMQPDFALAMLFIIVIINKDDYKMCLGAAIVTGIFTAMTTKFPGGQIPNIVDKIITVNCVYLIVYFLCKIRYIHNLQEEVKNYVIVGFILPTGTLISGMVFLLSAQIIVGLPAEFTSLLIIVVLPAIIINFIAGLFLYKIVNLSLKRVAYSMKN